MGTVITDPALLAEIEAASVNAPAAKSGMIPFSPEWKEAQDRMAYKEAFDEGSGFDQFMAGVGKPVMQLEAGVMNLLGLGDDEYQAEAEQGTTMMEEQHGIPALAGNIVGETAMLALPATKAAQGTLGAMKGYSGLSKAAGTIAAESGLVGGYEFLKEPESDETRLGNAAEAAAWTAVLGAPFSAIRGSRDSVSDTARELLDEGAPLTPGMASETGMATTAERFMSNIPILGRKVKALQDAAIEKWNLNTLRKVSPMSNADETITDIGHKGFQQVQDDFSVAYRDLWDDVKPDNININAVNEGTESSLEALRLLPKHAQARARKDVIHLATEIKKFADSGDTLYLDQLDDFLRKKMNAGDDQFVKDFYSDMRGNFRNAMPDDIPDLLNQIDSVYRDFKTVEHGAGYLKPQEMKAVFTPRQIESAVKAKNSASATTKGEAGPVQDLAGKATDTVAQVLPDRSEISSAADLGRWGTLLGLVTAPVAVATLPFSKVAINETMRKMMTGLPLSKAEQRVAAALCQAGVTGIKESGMQREPIAPPMLEGENYYP